MPAGRKGGKTSRKHGNQTRKPSTKKYWAFRVLERHKVRNLIRHNGMKPSEALAHWRRVRRTRTKWSEGRGS
jgi:hypothetical protein